jgi:hypothetical protein
MARKYRRWSRDEYDRLETLINQRWRYADIAAEMGREIYSVIGAAQRIGLMSKERQGWRMRKDWAEIDRTLTDCIEAKMMTVPQAHAYMTSIGQPVAMGALYRRLKTMPLDVQRRAKKNTVMRMTAVCHRVHRRKTA